MKTPSIPRPRHRRRGRQSVVLALVAVSLVLAGCSDDKGDDKGAADSTTTTATSAPDGSSTSTTGTSTTGTATAKKLHILVTNDDGYASDGIDAVVQGLLTLPDVEVTVVAPLEQQSAQGGKSTDGEVAVTDVKTKSGYAAKAVDGFPVDSVRVAIDELKIEADLTVSGINAGQNLGPLLDLSGTVGAARASVARGIPALAVSQGLGAPAYDYQVAVPLVLDWVRDMRESILAKKAATVVTSLNVPSCAAGTVKGLVEVPSETDGDDNLALKPQDCGSAKKFAAGMKEVEAFTVGYATINEVPSEPQKPAEVIPADKPAA